MILLSDVGFTEYPLHNKNQIMLDIDLATIDELRESFKVKMEKYRRSIEKAYNKYV